MIKKLENQNELVMSSLHKQQEINAMLKAEFKTMSQSHSPSIQMKDDDGQTHFYAGLPSYTPYLAYCQVLCHHLSNVE